MREFTDLGPPEWAAEASCAGLATADYDPWHPSTTDSPTVAYAAARRICQSCPVRLECLHEGLRLLQVTQVLGMWGGLTPDELRALARNVGEPARKMAQHGTRARYVPPWSCRCDLCCAANARDEHSRRLQTA